jgi:hypothetical protein
MSHVLALSSNEGDIVIEMADMNPTFNFDYNNPVITIPTPFEEVTVNDNLSFWKTVSLNLNMSSQTVIIEFSESSGIGNNGAAPNYFQPVTVFEKIINLTCRPNEKKKILYMNGGFFGFVEISGYRLRNDPGRKDYVIHTLSLAVVSSVGAIVP